MGEQQASVLQLVCAPAGMKSSAKDVVMLVRRPGAQKMRSEDDVQHPPYNIAFIANTTTGQS